MERGYELIKKIAGGGMGEVFVARLTGVGDFEKRVALKFLLPHLADSSELVRRFHEEARLAARMHHPNIVEIFDVGEADGRPFIAMQLVDGVTLGRLLREVSKAGIEVPLPLVRLIATGLCEALGYAHGLADGQGRALQVVHRDVTPGNILVSRNGAVLLTDFGIARIRDGSHTEPGAFRGKAAYVAPEQVTHSAKVDARADLYAAALTLYECLTGTQPFKRDHFADSLKAVAEGKIEPIESLRGDVTPQLAAAIRKALSRNPEDRFASARAFREALVDGPVATSPELAEFVKLHGGVDESTKELVEGTRSIITVTPTQLELPAQVMAPPPPERRGSGRVVLVGLGAVLGLVALGAFAFVQSQTQTPTAQVPARIAEVEVEPDAGLVEVAEVEAPPPTLPTPTFISTPVPKPITRRTPKAPALVRVGYLSADASPWAEVLLNGKVLDRTPFAKFPLPAGKHIVTFRGPGGATQRRTIQVSEGAVTAVRVEF